MKILVISTSLSGNKTRNATKQFYQMFTSQKGEHQLEFFDLRDKDIAFSDGRNYLDYQGDTLALLTAIMDSDTIVFSAPIYQGSISAALKNIFDLLPTRAFERKVVGLILTAGSSRHYLVGETQIKPILSYMYATIISKYVYITDGDFKADGTVNDDIEFRFQALIEDVLTTAETYETVFSKQDDLFGF